MAIIFLEPPAREVVIAATLVLEVEDGCNSDVQDSSKDAFLTIKDKFFAAVSYYITCKTLQTVEVKKKTFWFWLNGCRKNSATVIGALFCFGTMLFNVSKSKLYSKNSTVLWI